MAKKFIINNDNIVISSTVDFHKEIAQKCAQPEKTKSGGWWEIIDDKLYFYGVSSDYGVPEKEDIIKSIQNSGPTMAQLEIWYSPELKLADALKNCEKIRDKVNV